MEISCSASWFLDRSDAKDVPDGQIMIKSQQDEDEWDANEKVMRTQEKPHNKTLLVRVLNGTETKRCVNSSYYGQILAYRWTNPVQILQRIPDVTREEEDFPSFGSLSLPYD